MKKLKNLTLACLLIFGLAACSDDDKSSDNPPVINTDETVISEFTGKINQENENTIKFTNPYSTDANLRFNIYDIDSSIKIDTVNSTCDCVKADYYYTINSKLAAGASCEIKYTFKPDKLDTVLLNLNIDYIRTFESYCPTPDTVPSYETVITINKYVDMYIYNYAEDSSGNKSPEYINIEIPAEWSASGNISNLDIVSYTKDFNLPAKQGEYSFNIYGATLTSNDENCSISGDTYNKMLTVKNNNGCSLKVTAKTKYVSPIKFSPKQTGNPYYNVSVKIDAEYTYSILDENYSKTFSPEYYASSIDENTYFDAGLLKDSEKVTSYEITGTNADKFKVAPTKHNSCTVTAQEISIPAGQTSCFFTVEIADKTESGNWTAELKTTLNTGDTNTYNIDGDVSLMTVQQILQNICKENSTENKQSSKAYKLF